MTERAAMKTENHLPPARALQPAPLFTPRPEFTPGEVDKAVMHCAVRRLRPANGIKSWLPFFLARSDAIG
jgi:hypothetical protein